MGQIQGHYQQIERTGANWPERFIAPRASLNSVGQLPNAAQLAQFAIKVSVLEEWLIRVAANREEILFAAKESAIA